jgi:hypothetical protein
MYEVSFAIAVSVEKRTYTAVTGKKSQEHVKQDAKKVVKACNFMRSDIFMLHVTLYAKWKN